MLGDDVPEDVRVIDRHGIIYVLDESLVRCPDEDGKRVWTVEIPAHIDLPENGSILIGKLPGHTEIRVIFTPPLDPFLDAIADR